MSCLLNYVSQTLPLFLVLDIINLIHIMVRPLAYTHGQLRPVGNLDKLEGK